MCRPLHEDEFSHAIIDNYYSPKNFDFSLSYDQVFNLVQLFYLRKINVTHNLNYFPNKIIRMVEKDYNNTGKSSRHFVKSLDRHLTDHKLQLQSKASLNASINGCVSAGSTYDQHYPSRCEFSPLSEDPVSDADCSNAGDVSFERYDPTCPTGTSIQESMNEKVINSLSPHRVCYDTEKDNLHINASKSVLCDESEETYPFTKSKLRSDVEFKRISVFSRLSVDPKTAIKRKSFSGSDNLIMTAESSKQSKNLERNTRRRSTSMLPIEKSVVDEYVFNTDSIIAEIRPNFEKRETDGGPLYNHEKLERLIRETDGSKHIEAGTKVVPHDESENVLVRLNNSLPSERSQNNDSIDEAIQTFKKLTETDDRSLYDHEKLELVTSDKRKKPDDGSKHVEFETKVVPHDESHNISICLKNSLLSECNRGKVGLHMFNNGSIAEERRSLKKMGETDDGALYEHKKLELLSAEEKNKPENGSKHVQAETRVVLHDESDNISVCFKNRLPFECSHGVHAINNHLIADVRPTSTKMEETDDGALYEHKKPVLLCTEERNKSEDVSKRVDSERKAVPHNESDNISVCLKNSLHSECIQTKVVTDDTENGRGCRKKEIKSKNLLWFLQKTKDLIL